jgi:hypothetical protein
VRDFAHAIAEVTDGERAGVAVEEAYLYPLLLRGDFRQV